MKSILIKEVDILTLDKGREFIKSGSIGIKDGYIEFVEESGAILEEFKPDRIIYGRHKLAMPGLVNAHTHCGMTILRGLADDMVLEDWLFNHIFPMEKKLAPEDVYWGSMLGIAEMIKSGTTAFADMYLHMDMVAKTVLDTGIRANLSKSPLEIDRNRDCRHGEEWNACFDYFNTWNDKGNGRIKVYIEVHSAYLFDKELLRESANLAKHCGTGIHMHLLETEKERLDSIDRYGMNSCELCDSCGIFSVPVIAAHCVHTSDEDIQTLKLRDVNVVHNPTSNLKLGSGIARVPDMLQKGICVSLGTDGAASNNNLNMFEEVSLAALLHKGVRRNPELMDADTVLRMAVSSGAKAVGFEGETGSIKAGMKADLILIDTDKPHFYPMYNPASAIVYCAQGADVDTVIVDGVILMENRELKTIDEQYVKYMAKKTADRIKSRDRISKGSYGR